MRQSLEGIFVQRIEVGTLQRKGRRLHQDRPLAMALDQALSAVWGLLGLDHLRQPQQEALVLPHLFPRGQLNAVREIGGRGRLRPQQYGRSPNAAEIRVPATEPVRDLADCQFAHAVNQDIGFGVRHDGGLELVLPVIVVHDAAHAGFHAAQDHGQAGERLPAHLGVDHRRVVRAFAGRAVLAVDVFLPLVTRRRVIREHRIQVAGRHPAEQPGTAHALNRLNILPVRLGNDPHAITLGFEHPTDHRRAERRMIDVGVAGDQQDIDFGPAPIPHLGGGGGQKARWRRRRCWFVGVHDALPDEARPRYRTLRSVTFKSWMSRE